MDQYTRAPSLCPRCGEQVPETAYLEPLSAAPGRAPAFRLRHSKPDGKYCVAYVGPAMSEESLLPVAPPAQYEEP